MVTPRAAEKKELILQSAKNVFTRKGFNRVTMKDIIEESQISRGGIYLYFSSVDEIFVEVVKRRNRSQLQALNAGIEKKADFHELVESFFNDHADSLLNMDKSLFWPMMEFCCQRKNDFAKRFYDEQYSNTKATMSKLFQYGRDSKAITVEDIETLSDTIMFLIEGLRTVAISGGLNKETIDRQLRTCKEILYSDLL